MSRGCDCSDGAVQAESGSCGRACLEGRRACVCARGEGGVGGCDSRSRLYGVGHEGLERVRAASEGSEWRVSGRASEGGAAAWARARCDSSGRLAGSERAGSAAFKNGRQWTMQRWAAAPSVMRCCRASSTGGRVRNRADTEACVARSAGGLRWCERAVGDCWTAAPSSPAREGRCAHAKPPTPAAALQHHSHSRTGEYCEYRPTLAPTAHTTRDEASPSLCPPPAAETVAPACPPVRVPGPASTEPVVPLFFPAASGPAR